jgi:hypothetical protein
VVPQQERARRQILLLRRDQPVERVRARHLREPLDQLLRGIQLVAPSVTTGSLDTYERIARQGVD